MKTIVQTSTGLSKFLLEDSTVIESTPKIITVGNPAEFRIIDPGLLENITVYESINPPEDWQGNKYFYDGSEWSVNPDWVEPA